MSIYLCDCLNMLDTIGDNSIDLLVTDPPYGLSFMGKDWDKAVPSVEIWSECLRVLKPGAFAFVMCIPRQDCLAHMVVNLGDAGFETGFTSMYWTYASGFPKAGNIGKQVDNRLGAERTEFHTKPIAYPDSDCWSIPNKNSLQPQWGIGSQGKHKNQDGKGNVIISKAKSPEAKALDGSYAGFQPKPAVEVILVCMKPLSKKTYVEQALYNGKGITWLDDCRVPYESDGDKEKHIAGANSKRLAKLGTFQQSKELIPDKINIQQGRFPANLLVSDDVLNDGEYRHGAGKAREAEIIPTNQNIKFKGEMGTNYMRYGDSGSFSRYFDLDKWYNKTFPFFITPKASKSEKNKGCEKLFWLKGKEITEELYHELERENEVLPNDKKHKISWGNIHNTVKPLKLMCYLLTIASRLNDVVVDPFMGSGTTGVACKMLSREFIGMDIEKEYFKIAKARIDAAVQR